MATLIGLYFATSLSYYNQVLLPVFIDDPRVSEKPLYCLRCNNNEPSDTRNVVINKNADILTTKLLAAHSLLIMTLPPLFIIRADTSKIKKKICSLRRHILIERSSLRSQVWARLGRTIWSSRSVILYRRAARSGLFERRASRSVLCFSHTFKFISYNLILKLKPIL